MNKQEYTNFADLAITRRKIKDQFLNQINTLIDWKRIDAIIGKSYSKGENVTGLPSYQQQTETAQNGMITCVVATSANESNMNRAFRSRPLTEEDRNQNKEISKMQTQHFMKEMASNLYRLRRIAMSICVD